MPGTPEAHLNFSLLPAPHRPPPSCKPWRSCCPALSSGSWLPLHPRPQRRHWCSYWHLTTFYLQWKLWVLTSARHGTLLRAARAVFTFSLIPLVFPACRAQRLWVAFLSEHLLVICALVVHPIGFTSVCFLVCEEHAYMTCWRGSRRPCSSVNLTLNRTLTNRLH